ncbi:MAG: tetratricopeptide repeat protein [Thermodesulfobacteriota bacterium]|nr:tetratricopeptide repeat protein [Thermodesulfobacteriota bacterium]
MDERALQRIFVILDKQEKEQLETLCRILSDLFFYVELTSNLYIVAEDLAAGMPQVERIQKQVTSFLRENLFARLYVHFIHGAPQGNTEQMDFYFQYYYQNWKRVTMEFDREAYMHQEVPRLMLLPLIAPSSHTNTASLADLLGTLKSAFLLPSLYLDWGTFHQAANEKLLAKAEKVYYGPGNNSEKSAIVCSLCHENIIHETSSRLDAHPASMTEPCPAALIITASDGMVYPCADAFVRKKSLANIYAAPHVDTLMAQYNGYFDSGTDCQACRDRVVAAFSDLPLPKGATHELSDLLYHFGTLHQEAQNHVLAAERYEKSLKLSPAEEAVPIHFRLGLSYLNTGRYDQGLESFGKAKAMYQDQYYFHFYTGLCYFEKGDYGMALERFLEALDMDPQQDDLVRILIYLGTCCNGLGDYEQAIVQLERAKHEAGQVKEIYNALGFSYFQLKDYDKAIENLKVAVELDPYSAIDYASLGANYRERGDMDMAAAMYERALKLDPDLAVARENLERLRDYHG